MKVSFDFVYSFICTNKLLSFIYMLIVVSTALCAWVPHIHQVLEGSVLIPLGSLIVLVHMATCFTGS